MTLFLIQIQSVNLLLTELFAQKGVATTLTFIMVKVCPKRVFLICSYQDKWFELTYYKDILTKGKEFHVVEKICDKKVYENGIIQYLIKWKGLATPVWELKEDCNCDELIEGFEKRLLENHGKNLKV